MYFQFSTPIFHHDIWEASGLLSSAKLVKTTNTPNE